MPTDPASKMNKHHPILGLVGGVGCGKSFVAGLFAELGAAVLAGDPLGHEALRQPEIIQQLVARWGQDILNAQGEIDRAKVGAIVFQQPAERKFLEQLSHPWIRAKLQSELNRLHADPAVPLIIMDAAVMLESGWSHVCDKLAFIDVPFTVRAERAAKQRGWPAEELARREANQWPLEQKRAKADFIIDNGGTADQTRAQVRQVWLALGLPLP